MPDPTFTEPPAAPSRSDAPAVFVARADAFVAWFATLYVELQAFVTWASAAGATLSAALAAALTAIDARVAASGLKGTSTTSRAIGTGSKAFVTQPGLSFAPGSIVTVSDAAAPDVNYLFGIVAAYNGSTGDITVSVSSAVGSGTKSSWIIAVAGPQGPAGTSLTKGDGSDIWTGTDDAKYVTSKALADASAPVASSRTGSFSLDLNAGLNFAITLTGNITFGVPTNMTDGDSGVIYLIQDGTGGRTLALNASIKKPGATPTLSTAGGAVDRLGYFVRGGVLELTVIEKGIA